LNLLGILNLISRIWCLHNAQPCRREKFAHLQDLIYPYRQVGKKFILKLLLGLEFWVEVDPCLVGRIKSRLSISYKQRKYHKV